MNEQQGRAAIVGWQRVVDATYEPQAALAQSALAQPAPVEYTQIQQFIHDEMVRNSASPTVAAIKLNNFIPGGLGRPTAYALWVEKVRSGGDWDHKTDILERTAGRNTFTPLPGGNGNIRYDLWSNIHYGYVGTEANFTSPELRTGANIADIVRGRTDAGDDAAVRIGIELRQQYPPDQLRPEHINQAIERYRTELEQTGMIGPTVR